MRRRVNLPGQLTLDFESGYLAWIDLRGETFDAYETTTKKLFAVHTQKEANDSILQESVFVLNR